jgi:hypothetical protein
MLIKNYKINLELKIKLRKKWFHINNYRSWSFNKSRISPEKKEEYTSSYGCYTKEISSDVFDNQIY